MPAGGGCAQQLTQGHTEATGVTRVQGSPSSPPAPAGSPSWGENWGTRGWLPQAAARSSPCCLLTLGDARGDRDAGGKEGMQGPPPQLAAGRGCMHSVKSRGRYLESNFLPSLKVPL